MSTPASVEAAARAAARDALTAGEREPWTGEAYVKGYLRGHAARDGELQEAKAALERANGLLREVPYYIGMADSLLPKGTPGRQRADELFAAVQAHLSGEEPR